MTTTRRPRIIGTDIATGRNMTLTTATIMEVTDLRGMKITRIRANGKIYTLADAITR